MAEEFSILADASSIEVAPMPSGRRLPLQSSSAGVDVVPSSCAASTSSVFRDPVAGPYDRDTFLSAFFRETDRAQRMRTSLTLLAFSIHDANHSSTALVSTAPTGRVIQVIRRAICILRSYDVVGEIGDAEFAIVLPGCDSLNAVRLAERLRGEIIENPSRVEAKDVRLSACFGIATSNGRTPIVVLREAEQALRQAEQTGPGSMQFQRVLTPGNQSGSISRGSSK